MIRFIQPYLDQDEVYLIQSHRTSQNDIDQAIQSIHQSINHLNFIITQSGEQAIETAIRHAKTQHNWDCPIIAIPSACCGSVYRPAKKEGKVILMDAGTDWNCIYDEHAQKADIVLFASLGGCRIELPQKRDNQVFIDDAAQCFDGICGLRPEADYGIFSFGNGKQMFAQGGGILCSVNHEFTGDTNFGKLPHWQIVLMASQLNKIKEITNKTAQIGKSYQHYLKAFPWLRMPPHDSCYSKFVVFISQPNAKLPEKIPGRTEEIWRFIRHMAKHHIQIEETYIPLHIRFPDELKESRYQNFNVNHLWIEAITLPCRPNMTTPEVQQVIDAVREFNPSSVTNKNRMVYEHKYGPLQKPKDGYFRNLYETRLQAIQNLGHEKKCIDLGCGNGLHMIPLLEQGMDITGIDFSESMLKSFNQHCPKPTDLVNGDIQNIPFNDQSFDMAYSIATLYYVPDTEKAIQEIYRILKSEGTAYLEFGNRNSLNHFEAKRVSTGAISIHIDINWLNKYLEEIGFTIFKTERFQVFPLYGNIVSKSIEQIFAEKFIHNGHQYMLDEWVSNAPFISQYAFRYCVYLYKGQIQKEINQKILVENPQSWISDQKGNQRSDAVCKPLKQQLLDLCDMMAEDPTDAITFYALAKLHVQTEEEHQFVNQIKKDIDKYIEEKCS